MDGAPLEEAAPKKHALNRGVGGDKPLRKQFRAPHVHLDARHLDCRQGTGGQFLGALLPVETDDLVVMAGLEPLPLGLEDKADGQIIRRGKAPVRC